MGAVVQPVGQRGEDALYDSTAMRSFAGIDLSVENVSDVIALLKFCRLRLQHGLTRDCSVCLPCRIMAACAESRTVQGYE